MRINRDIVDNYADNIPIISVFTNAVNLYEIIFVIPKLSSTEILADRHFTRLKLEGAGRCIVAMLPGGRPLLIRFYDFIKQKSNDRAYIEDQVRKHGVKALDKAGPYLRNDANFVSSLLDDHQFQDILPYIGDLLRNDPDFIEHMYSDADSFDEIRVINIAGPEVRNNAKIMYRLLDHHPDETFAVLDGPLLCDPDFMFSASAKIPLVDFFEKLPDSMKNHSQFLIRLLVPVGQENYSDRLEMILNAAGEIPRNDPNFMGCVRTDSQYLESLQTFLDKVGPELRKNKTFLRRLDWVDAFSIADADLMDDPEFIRGAYSDLNWDNEQRQKVLSKVGSKLKDDSDFMKEMTGRERAWALDNMSERLSNDQGFIRDLIDITGFSEAVLNKIGPKLRNDRSFVGQLINWFGIKKVCPILGSELDPKFIISLIGQFRESMPAILERTGTKLRNDPNFILDCLNKVQATILEESIVTETYQSVLNIVGDELRDNQDFFQIVQKFFADLKLYSGIPQCVFAMLGNKLKNDVEFIKVLLIDRRFPQVGYILETAGKDAKANREFYLYLSNKYTAETLAKHGFKPPLS